MAASLNTEDPQIDVVVLDEKYTYVFDHGNVSILRHGQPWMKNPEGSKAWITVGNEIADLRAKVATLEAQLAAAGK